MRPIKLLLLILSLSALFGCETAGTETAAPTGGPAATAEPTVEVVPTEDIGPLPEGMIRVEVPASALETAAALLAAERRPRDYYRLAVELAGIQAAPPEGGDAPEWELDDRKNFFIRADLSGGNDFKTVPARLRYLTENAAWWSSVTARVDDAELAAAAENFEALVMPTNRLLFGKEWSPGIDNDRRIHFLLVEETAWGGFFGYFSRVNEYPTSLEPFSNMHEMLTINVTNYSPASETFPGKLAHEYQHLIQWNHDENEDLWLNESLSELAYFLSGSPVLGTPFGPTNIEIFAENPQIQLTSRPERRFGDEDLATFMHYGAEKNFSVYLLERFGPEFIQNLAQNEAPGVISIQQEFDKLPEPMRFQDVYADWIVANLLIQPNLLNGQFGYREYLPVRPLREIVTTFEGSVIADELAPYGARYYELVANGPVQASFTGTTLARLTPLDPPSGRYVWYSGRGDNSEFSLTRSFDLSGVSSATLDYKIWYELEDFFDYAYVQVSTDGGATWTILETAHGTSENPMEQAFGLGYTGVELEWLEESIDLSAYAGQEILLRFQVLTDFSTNREGIQLDDIAIPEIGFFDGAEDDSGGWEAVGFIRSTNFVPVEWIVWLIELTSPTRVTRIVLSPEQAAEFEIKVFSPVAAVIVSPTAPITTQELPYELIFQQP